MSNVPIYSPVCPANIWKDFYHKLETEFKLYDKHGPQHGKQRTS